MSKHLVSSVIFGLPAIFFVSCGGANFAGLGGEKSKSNTVQSNSPIPTSPADEAPICKPSQRSIGANIAFLIDNSSSNSLTDCPGATKSGRFQDTDVYSCSGETNRERAVLAAFDLLGDVSTRDQSPSAASNLSIVGFPAANNAVQGVQIATNGWVSTRPAQENRATVKSALQFTRQPMGATPYGSAVNAATELFSLAPVSDERAKVAVLVTDGEPTDRDPADVAARAQALQASGVEVITVFITNSQTRADRQSVHAGMLASWEQRSRPGHFYNSQRYTSFDDYLNDVLGRAGRVSLTEAVTSKVVPTCVDAVGSVCQRWKVEITDSAGLSNVVKQIIRTRAVRCE
jgi:hypothetical protein